MMNNYGKLCYQRISFNSFNDNHFVISSLLSEEVYILKIAFFCALLIRKAVGNPGLILR